jgi:small multidrug resistance pump
MMAAYFMYVVTLFGFSLTLKQIDMSIAYAVWSALGTGIVAVAGVVLFNEVYGLKKLLCVACIIVGVAGLNLLDH